MRNMDPYLSIILPAYNEEENLLNTVQLLKEKISPLVPSVEILIVDDGSTDRTGEIADGMAERDSIVRVFRHPTNQGPGSGVHTALPLARGEWIIFIPADIAIDLDQFQKYLEAAKECDVVVGIRSDRSDYSLLRKLSSVVYIALIKLLFNMKERQFNYVHMYRRNIFDHFHVDMKGVFITAEIMIKARDAGFRLKEVEINYVPRVAGVATCGRPSVISRTIIDMFRFWIS